MRRAVESGAFKVGMAIIMGKMARIASMLAIGASAVLKGGP